MCIEAFTGTTMPADVHPGPRKELGDVYTEEMYTTGNKRPSESRVNIERERERKKKIKP